MSEHSTSQLATLIQLGKEQGYLTYAEINDQLPESVTESDQIDDIIQMLTDVGIKIFETAPDEDDIMLSDDADDDEIAVDEAAAVLASVESEQVAPPTLCVCTCVRWVRLTYSPVKARLRLLSVSKMVFEMYNMP